MTDIVEVASGLVEIIEVESGSVEIVEIAVQGPPGIQGEAGFGFTTGVDIISGGAPATDYTNDYQFSGGTP
jgi:hypothetical protein